MKDDSQFFHPLQCFMGVPCTSCVFFFFLIQCVSLHLLLNSALQFNSEAFPYHIVLLLKHLGILGYIRYSQPPPQTHIHTVHIHSDYTQIFHSSSLALVSQPLPFSSHFHFSSPQLPERMIAKSPLAISKTIGNSFRPVSITFLSSSGTASDNIYFIQCTTL